MTLGDSFFRVPLDLGAVEAPHIWTMPIRTGDDPSRYGQVTCAGDRVTHLWEKPQVQHSDIIQTGIWKLPFEMFRRTRLHCAGADGEVHIGDVTKQYVIEQLMTHTRLPADSYIDCGTPEAYIIANQLAWSDRLE